MSSTALYNGSTTGWAQSGAGAFTNSDATLTSTGGLGMLWFSAKEFHAYSLKLDWMMPGTDKTALVHVPVGKISFPPDKLIDNATTVITSVVKAKPSVAKGKYIKGCTLSSSMGPGIQIDTSAVEAAAKA